MEKKLNCVMLIDDDEATNYFNQFVLEKSGYVKEIITKENGKDALQYLQSISDENKDVSRPDLIFLDINMPAMNGWEFLEEYKKLNEAQKSKMMIVMLTTSLLPEDKMNAVNQPEISAFENKPLTKEKVRRILESYFASHTT
jgi:CheY-like chemotaxis protein